MNGAFLYAGAAGVGAGIALALWFPLGFLVALWCLGVAAIALLVSWLARKPEVMLVSIFFVALGLGIARTAVFRTNEDTSSLLSYANQTASMVGTVANDPDVRDTEVRANVSVSSIDGAQSSGEVQAVFPAHTELAYGQRIEISGLMQTPVSFMGDNGNIFDYPGYLRVQGVSMLLNKASVTTVRPAPVSILGTLYDLKHLFEASLERALPEPEVSLMEGILLGQRRGLSDDLTAMFVAAGLIHIVILSGYSMSVVAESVLRALKFLPKRVALALGMLALIAFVLLTGAAATTVRACAMALIALVARYFNRRAIAMRSLVVVAAAMALLNPPILLLDASFIVSVLATFGLIAFAPTVEKYLPRSIKNPELRSIITSTIAVQILALPALIYYTGTVSLLSVPANLLVLPLLGYVMLAGFITGLVGFISPLLAAAPAIVSTILLGWILLVVRVVYEIPFAAASITAFPWWGSVLLYILLVPLAIILYRTRQTALR